MRTVLNRCAGLVFACTLGAAVVAPSMAGAQNSPPDTVSLDDVSLTDTVSPADTVSLADMPTRWRAGAPIVAIGPPTDIVLAPDGRRAYLINGFGCTVQVLDLASHSLIGAPIVVGFEPSTLAITPDGAWACVANWRDFNVSVIDLAADSVVGGPIALRGFVDASGATDVAITPDGKRALATISQGSIVGVIDLKRHRVTSRIKLENGGPSSVAITPDGSRALVLTGGFNALWIIDLAENRVVGAPVKLNGNPSDLAISPDGKLAYALVNSRGNNSLSIIDVTAGSPRGEPIALGGGNCDCPNTSIAITRDGARAYVTNRGNVGARLPVGDVRVIDLVERKVTGPSIETGPSPIAVKITPDWTRAYVLNSGDGTISTIDLATNQVTGTPIKVGRHLSIARRRLLAAEQLRHLEDAADKLFSTDIVPRSGIKLVDLINGAGEERRGGVKAEYILRKIKQLREQVEIPCPKCEQWPTGYNNELTNMVLDLRYRLTSMMDDDWPTQPLVDVLTAVGMELGFW